VIGVDETMGPRDRPQVKRIHPPLLQARGGTAACSSLRSARVTPRRRTAPDVALRQAAGGWRLAAGEQNRGVALAVPKGRSGRRPPQHCPRSPERGYQARPRWFSDRSNQAALFGVNPWRLQAWMGQKRIDETMLYVHVAKDHRRDLPTEVIAAGANEVDPDRRVLLMLGARGTKTATCRDRAARSSPSRVMPAARSSR
jgi:hypothetical protein